MERCRPSRATLLILGLGLYLTCRGYHSFDGDQAYRLPLLLHRQDAQLYANDPFVRAFEAFNPHEGFLNLLDLASRPLGLAWGILGLFVATFAVTAVAIDRLARGVWPDAGRYVGCLAAALIFAAKAGNIGTNHLFEAMLLDRLVAMALGWTALAELVTRPRRAAWTAPVLMAMAAWIHPSVGLQVSLWLVATWVAMLALPDAVLRGGCRGSAILGLVLLGLALAPSLARIPGQSRRLMEGLDPEAFYILSARVQSPQHMLPHLWRMPQWLAAASYLVLGALALSTWSRWGPGRRRLALLLGTNLVGLAAAWVAVEVLHDVRATVFQPFRMATPARGLCLVLLAGYLVSLWRGGGAWGRSRAAILAVGLTGDWSLVVALAVELASGLGMVAGPRAARGLGALVLALGLSFLARHDTEAGHLRLAGALAFGILAGLGPGLFAIPLGRARLIRVGVVAWALPLAAVVVPGAMSGELPTWAEGLVAHCRFLERPIDEAERLAAWSRDHLPTDARFVGPPGPKTFRLWSRREVAFNRAASPYHAEGLDDWARRFQDHVGFEGTRAEFARAYLRDRRALERGFEAMSPESLAALAARQGAGYVLAASRLAEEPGGRLELLRRDGDLAIFRVRPPRRIDGLTSRRP